MEGMMAIHYVIVNSTYQNLQQCYVIKYITSALVVFLLNAYETRMDEQTMPFYINVSFYHSGGGSTGR